MEHFMWKGFIIEDCSHDLDFRFYLVKFISKVVIPSDGFLEAFNLLGNMFTEFNVRICDRTGRRIGRTDGTG
jgi:hypothetical protein